MQIRTAQTVTVQARQGFICRKLRRSQTFESSRDRISGPRDANIPISPRPPRIREITA